VCMCQLLYLSCLMSFSTRIMMMMMGLIDVDRWSQASTRVGYSDANSVSHACHHIELRASSSSTSIIIIISSSSSSSR